MTLNLQLSRAVCLFLLQIYDGMKKPEVLVDGWNVYFFDDLKTLVSVLFFWVSV